MGSEQHARWNDQKKLIPGHLTHTELGAALKKVFKGQILIPTTIPTFKAAKDRYKNEDIMDVNLLNAHNNMTRLAWQIQPQALKDEWYLSFEDSGYQQIIVTYKNRTR